MPPEYDAIVVGLGGLGSAAAYWLARTNHKTLGLEQFELGHVHGESQDHSRIIRLSYHTREYVELAKQAYQAWEQLEEQVVLKTGGLDFAPRTSAIPLHTYTDSLTAAGIPYEPLDARAIMQRWPQFTLTEEHGIYQPDAGLVMAAKANAAHQRLAREYGATLQDHVTITRMTVHDKEVEVHTTHEKYRAQRLILAAGPWSNQALSHFQIQLPLEVTQEQVVYFATPHTDEFTPDRFPVWIWMDDPCFYGFPVFGEPATKVGQDAGGHPVTTKTRTYTPDPTYTQRIQTFLHKYLPRARGPIHTEKTCLYTLTPDRDFVLDYVPGTDNKVSVAIGAGHAFKFASLIGKLLAEETHPEQFRITRKILTEKNPPKSYMV